VKYRINGVERKLALGFILKSHWPRLVRAPAHQIPENVDDQYLNHALNYILSLRTQHMDPYSFAKAFEKLYTDPNHRHFIDFKD